MSIHQSDHRNNQKRWIAPLHPRSTDEEHRPSTPLELFFDLVFVVAIAQASSILHHHLAEAHVVAGIACFVVQFFAIWWAWMNFTWFASAYDNGDIAYKLLVFVQMAGALMLAAGIPGFVVEDGTLQVTEYAMLAVGGYVVMRLAMVIQWLRAARADELRRKCARRYAIGIVVCQIGWILLLFIPVAFFAVGFIVMAIAELLVPVWAERAGATTWHAEHILERYGLFTIIVLGESILALSLGIRSALEAGEVHGSLIYTIVGGLLILFSMWWFYFDRPMQHMLTSLRRGFIWGYGHYLVFASAAAVGAGLAVAIDQQLHHAHLGPLGADYAIIIPVSVYLFVLYCLHLPVSRSRPIQVIMTPAFIVLILLTPLSGLPAALLTGILLMLLLAVKMSGFYLNK